MRMDGCPMRMADMHDYEMPKKYEKYMKPEFRISFAKFLC